MVSQRKITVFLLKDSYRRGVDALKHPKYLTKVKILDSHSEKVEMYLKTVSKHEPSWIPFVSEIVEDDLSNYSNTSCSGIIFVYLDNNIFALTLSYGFNLLKTDSYIKRFGMITTINAVGPEGVKALDHSKYEEQRIKTKVQASVNTELSAFNVNLTEDILQGVEGVPEDTDYALYLAGKDSLRLSAYVIFLLTYIIY